MHIGKILPTIICASALCCTLKAATPLELDFPPGTKINLVTQLQGTNYVWRKDGTRLLSSEYVIGTSLSQLTIFNCTPANSGYYELYGANLTEELAAFKVTVTSKTSPPIYKTVGEEVEMTGAEGAYEYQWFRNGQALPDGGRIQGTKSYRLQIQNAQETDGGTYVLSCRGQPDPVVNAVFTLDVAPYFPPATPPAVQIEIRWDGADVKLIANATGTRPMTYQWFWQEQEIPGATADTLVYTNADLTANAGYYSVLVSNRAGEAWANTRLLFTKPATKGKYSGVFFQSSTPSVESSGSLRLGITDPKRPFSGKVLLAGKSYSFTGRFSEAHQSNVYIAQGPDGAPLDLDLQVITTGADTQIIGKVNGAGWSSALRAIRDGYTQKSPPPQTGRYTMAFQRVGIARFGTAPDGSGFGAIRVGTSGQFSLTGRTADGAQISINSMLSKDGLCPIHVPLYKKQGCIVGWLSFGGTNWADSFATNILSTNAVNQGLAGGFYWLKNPSGNQAYPKGFSQFCLSFGSAFPTIEKTLPAGNVLPFTKGVAAFTGGDMFSNEEAVWDFVKVSVSTANEFSCEEGPQRLGLSVSPTSGVVSGSFLNYVTGLRCPIRGVVLQEQQEVHGYFLSGGMSGYFAILPRD